MTDRESVEYAILGGAIAIGFAAVLSILVVRDPIFFLVDGAIAVVLYMFGYMKVKQGKLDTAKIVILGGAIVTGILGLLSLVASQSLLGLLGFILGGGTAAALGYAFAKLGRIQ